MTLDVPTLIVVIVLITAMAGGLMLLSWLQNRAAPALLWWGAAYLCAAVGAAMLGARGHLPDVWSIAIANALLLGGAGLTWCGVRVFNGRRVAVRYALTGSAIWLAACSLGPFYQSLHARIVLASAIAATYAALAAYELWRSRGDGGALSRWLAMAVLSFHGTVYLVRIPLTWMAQLPADGNPLEMKWLPLGILEALFYSFATAFILLTMIKERAEARHKHDAIIDPLTGVPNRRGFTDRAERLLARCRDEVRPVSLLLFDLDHFKRVNDTFGHQVGDEVLVQFCRVVQQRLGADDVFARLGGEEFVCVLPGTRMQAAFAVAERIRGDFDATGWSSGGSFVRATVSVGVANSLEVGAELTGLLGTADAALYRAKAKGRNRVEGRRPAPVLVGAEPTQAAPLGAA